MTRGPIVVVGASLAGGRAVEALRKGGFDGRIVLVGDEPERPYDRPPLSKKFLRGEVPEEKVFLRPVEWYDTQRVELRLGKRAIALHAAAREVEVEGGERIAFDKLLVATGAHVRKLGCPGADLPGVHYLRSMADARAIRAELAPGRRLVVIGMGVIGSEVAASCRELGLEVVALEAAPVPLVRAFGLEIGTMYADYHRQKGADVRLGVTVSSIRGAGRAEEVVLSSGDAIPCDLVVVGVGVSPETGWLEGSGLALDDGVVVDERAESSLPGVFAAGDVAKLHHPSLGRHVRMESVDNALRGGGAAVNNMLGKPEIYDPVPYFWSDQYDLKLQTVGWLDDHDEVVFRGDVPGRAFAAFYVKQGILRGMVGVNRMVELMGAKKLIAASARVTAEALRDEGVTMGSLLPKPA